MTTIFKYPLQQIDRQVIQMPHGAIALDVQLQNGVPTLWAQVNDNFVKQDYDVLIIGTGGQVPPGAVYVATVQMPGGLVWHFYLAY